MQEGFWDHLKLVLWGALWSANLATVSRGRRRLLLFPRIAVMVGRELMDGQLGLRAASLVYTTLLSLVPLLAVSFALLKGFGVHEQLEEMLIGVLAPLGEQGIQIADRIVGFVSNVKVGVLGLVGLLVLIYTVISLLQKIESAFNEVWREDGVRPLRARVTHYLSAVVVGPVLVFTSIGLTASILGSETVRDIAAYDPFGVALELAGKAASYLLVVAAFTFVYVYMPNARVQLRSALVGALVAGLMWAGANWAFGTFVVGSTRYTAIYSSFAILIVFMLWLYVGWLVLLMGACVAFYFQHPECLGLLRHEVRLSNRLRERVALSAAWLIAAQHLHGGRPWTARRLALRLTVPGEPMERLLRALGERGVLLQAAPGGPWLPARDLSELRVLDVLVAVREAYEGRHLQQARIGVEPAAESLAAEMEQAAAAVAGDLTLREWVLRSGDSAPSGAPEAEDGEDTVDVATEAALANNTVPLRSPRREGGRQR